MHGYFFNSPFSGLVAQPGAWAFVNRLMNNHSDDQPEGYVNGEILKTFYSITGEDGNFNYTAGHERIPENWYKRNAADEYSLLSLATDLATMVVKYPIFASVGGNTGTVNSFTGINPSDLTNGVFNAKSLLEGNNAFCFGLRVTMQVLPEPIKDVLVNVLGLLDNATSQLTRAAHTLGCPQLLSVDKSQFAKFPGFTKLKADGTY
jgi:hypothetical protein